MRILAIETSCDETALAFIEASGGLRNPKFRVLKNIVSSQIAVHRPFGGVVPNLAKREHIRNLPTIWKRIMNNESGIKEGKSSIHNSQSIIPDAIAVTVGPGLEPALWTGVEFAKEIYSKLKTRNPRLKIVGVNHLEGHLYSVLLENGIPLPKMFPAIALIVSGGHTILLKVESLVKWKKLGETRDDAVGEAFDKVAKMLNLPYPGGPEIQRMAARGNFDAINFPRPMLHDNSPAGKYNFSFSGLKTSVLYYIRDHKLITNNLQQKADIAASFQAAAIDVLSAKTERAAKEFDAKSIVLAGGVAANEALRNRLLVISNGLKVNFLVPPMNFNTDNAVMIAAAAYIQHLRKKNRRIIAQANLNL